MREPKEPKTFKYPRLYMGIRYPCSEDFFRLRIIYPDNTAEWTNAKLSLWHEELGDDWTDLPCWYSKENSLRGNIQNMKNYDDNIYRETIFLGEIK